MQNHEGLHAKFATFGFTRRVGKEFPPSCRLWLHYFPHTGTRAAQVRVIKNSAYPYCHNTDPLYRIVRTQSGREAINGRRRRRRRRYGVPIERSKIPLTTRPPWIMKRIHSALLIIGHKIYLIKFNCLSAGRAGTRVPACNILMEYPRHGSQVKRASERALRRPNTPPHSVIPTIIHDNKGISLYRLFLLFIPPKRGEGTSVPPIVSNTDRPPRAARAAFIRADCSV